VRNPAEEYDRTGRNEVSHCRCWVSSAFRGDLTGLRERKAETSSRPKNVLPDSLPLHRRLRAEYALYSCKQIYKLKTRR
jgi:hypothetical protein